MSVIVLWIKRDGRRMNMSCKFPGNATWKGHENVRANITSIGLLLPKITNNKVKVDTMDAKEFEYISHFRAKDILEVR